MATLDGLPPDVLVLILYALDSPRDLHSLISASRPCLAVFLSTRNQALTSVLKNAIPPGALRHALAAASAPHAVVGIAESPRQSPDPDIDTVKSILEGYFSTNPIEFPRDTAGIISLCRLYSQVSRFSDEYFLRATRLLGTSIDLRDPADAGKPVPWESRKASQEALPAPQEPLLVSCPERTRLYRAFFRYELFCRLFPPAYFGVSETIASEQQFELFLSRMEPWEVEEMSCAHGYLIFLIEGFVEDLEAQIMAAVLNSPSVQTAKGGQPCGGSPGSLNDDKFNRSSEEEMVPFDDLELRGLLLYERRANTRRVPRFIAKLAAYGLDFVTKMQNASPRDLKDIIRAEDIFPCPSFPDALTHAPTDDIAGADVRAPTGDDDVSRPNLGWRMRWDHERYRRVFDRYFGILWDPLRERGYVFWDAQRCRDPVVGRRVHEAGRLPYTDIAMRLWRRRESVEWRLRGVRLRRGEMQRIIREFSDCHGEEDDSDREL